MYEIAKRLFDLIAASLAFSVFSPVLLGIALLIKLDSPGPVFYRGYRAGKDGVPFRMWKFRTMVVDADRMGGPSTSADDPRLTRFGRFLRWYKLDEIPQLISILQGQMSLVGPRPEVLSEVETYTEEERELLGVVPGLIDYASMKFHNEEEILSGSSDPHKTYLEKIRPEKVRLGLEYVRTRSLVRDIGILLRCALTLVLSRFGRRRLSGTA